MPGLLGCHFWCLTKTIFRNSSDGDMQAWQMHVSSLLTCYPLGFQQTGGWSYRIIYYYHQWLKCYTLRHVLLYTISPAKNKVLAKSRKLYRLNRFQRGIICPCTYSEPLSVLRKSGAAHQQLLEELWNINMADYCKRFMPKSPTLDAHGFFTLEVQRNEGRGC